MALAPVMASRIEAVWINIFEFIVRCKFLKRDDSKGATSEGVTSEGVTSEGMTSEGVTSEEENSTTARITLVN